MDSIRQKVTLKTIIDLSLWSLAIPLAYALRLEMPVFEHGPNILLVMGVMLPFNALFVYLLGLNRQCWHKVGVLDVYALVKATAGSAVLLMALALVFRASDLFFIPYSVPFIELIVSFLLLFAARFSTRFWDEHKRKNTGDQSHQKNILIVGAGEAGTLMAREMLRHPEADMKPVGFLDDNPNKQSQKYLGLPVYGPLKNLKEAARTHKVDEVLIAVPSAPGKVVRKVVEMAREVGINYKILPSLHELINGNIAITEIRDVDMKDLLKREPVVLENKKISGYLRGRVVMITGAGGSIGSEMVRQVLKFNPSEIVLIDQSEYNIYKINQELDDIRTSINHTTKIANICDRDVLESIIQSYRPDVIFHAAAYKHVPLMEQNPQQAILNNVGGTKNLVELSLKYNVNRLVNISTDKAVNPTSVMGTSKRISEYIVKWGAQRCREDQVFVSVRFGNVLGSRGSVIPKFKQQIKRGDPITVTHPDMTRYFMTIPEASQLVLQAGGQADNGCIYVLDMGEPVRIVDMARDLIKLSGLIPNKDVHIVFTGMRPGEKLYEELLTDQEQTSATQHEKIHVAKRTELPISNFEMTIDKLLKYAYIGDNDQIKVMLKQIVPSYKFDGGKKEERKETAPVFKKVQSL